MEGGFLLDYTIKVLIIDDMPAMREILRGMFEEIGFSQITCMEDAESAWQLLQNSLGVPDEQFGLVICDWKLTGMSGVDLLRTLRSTKAFNGLPFIMVTSQSDQLKIRQASFEGTNAYLVKPFEISKLRETLEQVPALSGS